jgi:hypothetical protein
MAARQDSAEWETRGRAEKVAAMVRRIDERAEAKGQSPQGDAEQIAAELRAVLDDDAWWFDLQTEAGIGRGRPPSRRKPPSATTRNEVITRLELRVDREREEEQ